MRLVRSAIPPGSSAPPAEVFGVIETALRATRRTSGPCWCQISDKSVISLLDSRDRDEGGRPPPLILLMLVLRFDIALVVIPERPLVAGDRAKIPSRDRRTFDCDNCARAGLRFVWGRRRARAPVYTVRP